MKKTFSIFRLIFWLAIWTGVWILISGLIASVGAFILNTFCGWDFYTTMPIIFWISVAIAFVVGLYKAFGPKK